VNDKEAGGEQPTPGNEPEAAAETERDAIGPAGEPDSQDDDEPDEPDESNEGTGEDDKDILPYWLYPD
jgi:hypothetical protein